VHLEVYIYGLGFGTVDMKAKRSENSEKSKCLVAL